MLVVMSFVAVLAALAGLASLASGQQGMLWTFLGAVMGAGIASFINVVVHRLPDMMRRQWTKDCREHLELPAEPDVTPLSLVTPACHCVYCARPLCAWELVPVFSYILLRGQCRSCKSKINVRYPLVELSGALATGAVIALYGATLLAVVISGFVLASLAIALIDADTFLIPDEISLSLVWAGLLLSAAGIGPGLFDAVVGAAVGYSVLWLLNASYKLYRGADGMGRGDFKYLAACGAFFGWKALAIVVLIAGVTGAVAGLVSLWRAKESMSSPFGPYLVLGACAVLYLRPFSARVPALSQFGL